MRAFLFVLLFSACVHRIGETCNASEAHCLDKKTGLNCQNGALVATDCPGPKGCTVTGERQVMCDVTK